MRRIVVLVLFALLLMTLPLLAAGTATTTRYDVPRRPITRYTTAWTSTAGGAVSGNTFAVVPGYLLSIRFIPNTGGTQPSDLYDITLSDGDLTDLTSGSGTNLSNASSSIYQWNPPLFQDGTRSFDIVVANAGNAKTGTVVILEQTITQ